MACCKWKVIAESVSPDKDPELLKHLRECPTCWLDWQVAHGARYALFPQGEVRHDLIDRVMVKIRLQAWEQQRPTTWWEYGISGALVAAGTAVFLPAWYGDLPTPMAPVLHVLWLAGLSAVATVVFLRRQETTGGIVGKG